MKARDYSYMENQTWRRTIANIRGVECRITRVHRCGKGGASMARQGRPIHVYAIELLERAGKLVEVEHGGAPGQPGEFWTYRLAEPSALDWEI